jgi:hypothetical protein
MMSRAVASQANEAAEASRSRSASAPGPWFVPHLRNVHSQCGEDGVLERVFEILGCSSGWAVELGAADGVWLSNTRNVIAHKAWSGVLIECDARLHARLQENYRDRPDVYCVRRLVTTQGSAGDTIDAILQRTPIPRDFELLSIDVDGNDCHVWNSLAAYRPRVVVIEFNPTIPSDVSFVQVDDANVNQGASLRALVEVGKSKGYELVAATSWNAIFVVEEDCERLGIEDHSIESLRHDTSEVTHIFFGYDGTAFLGGAKRLPWHEVPIRECDVQVLPAIIRGYPPRYSGWRRRLFRLWRRWTDR